MRAIGLALGALIGFACGAGGGYLEILIREQLRDGHLVACTMAMHGVLWTLVGAGVGLSAGLVVSQRPTGQMVLAGAAAGLIAGLLYLPTAMILLPNADAERALPPGNWNRLLWIALPFALMAIALARVRPATPQATADQPDKS